MAESLADAGKDEALSPDEERTSAQTLSRCLRPMLSSLPETQADALALTDLGDLSQAEAARRLGISPSGMKSRVQRGRALLRSLLLQCCEVELDGRRGVVGYARRDGQVGSDPCSPSEDAEKTCEDC